MVYDYVCTKSIRTWDRNVCILCCVFWPLITRVQNLLHCCPTAFPRSLHHYCGIYRIVERALHLLALCEKSSCYICLSLAIIFICTMCKVLLQRWKLATVARWRITLIQSQTIYGICARKSHVKLFFWVSSVWVLCDCVYTPCFSHVVEVSTTGAGVVTRCSSLFHVKNGGVN